MTLWILYNMNLDIKIADKITHGIGDAGEILSTNLIHIQDPIDINISTKYHQPCPLDELTEDTRTILDYELTPGFFYIGDKEYYLYSQKVTEVIYLKKGSKSIKLKDYPNGYSHINLFGQFKKAEFAGIFLEELIIKKVPMYSLYLNEPTPPHAILQEHPYYYGPDYCLDIESLYPLVFNPFKPVTECYTYWETITQDNPWNPLLFDYDLFTNSLLLMGNILAGYYIIEYERSTLKTLTGENFNVTAKQNEPGFLSIDPGIENNTPDKLNIVHIGEQTPGKRRTIVLEVLNYLGNRIKNTELTISIKRVFTLESGDKVNTIVKSVNGYYTVYSIDPFTTNTNIYENNIRVATVPEGMNTLIVPTVGLLYNNRNQQLELSTIANFDQNGSGLIEFGAPIRNEPSQEVTLIATVGSRTLKEITLNNLNISTYAQIEIDTNELVYNYKVFPIKGSGNIKYIDSNLIHTTVDLELYPISEYVRYSTLGVPLRSLDILNIVPKFDGLKVSFSVKRIPNDSYVIARLLDLARDMVKLDSTQIYGIRR